MGRETKEVWLSSPYQTTPHLGVPEMLGCRKGLGPSWIHTAA